VGSDSNEFTVIGVENLESVTAVLSLASFDKNNAFISTYYNALNTNLEQGRLL
jgi:hypothetical protein